MLRLRVATGVHVRDELLERTDPFGLQSGVFGGEVPVGLGMTGAMAIGAPKNIFSKQVLRVRARAGAQLLHFPSRCQLTSWPCAHPLLVVRPAPGSIPAIMSWP